MNLKSSINKISNINNSITLTSSMRHLNNLLDEYQARLNSAVVEAELQDVINKSNIHNYEFNRKNLKPKILNLNNGSFIPIQQKLVKITSEVDFLDLSFKTLKATHRSYIKKFLSEKVGKKHFITNGTDVTVDDQGELFTKFTIRLHDPSNKKSLYKIIDLLKSQYGSYDFKITCIELAHDFRNSPIELLIALFKSIQFESNVHYIRVFRSKGENESVPFDPKTLKDMLLAGFNIGVNDYRKDDVYYHFYFKKTDQNKAPLPQKDWRLRAEVRLSNINVDLNDLPSLIKSGFKKLNFTQLDKSSSDAYQKHYSLYVRPYGKRLELPVLRNGHYRFLNNSIRAHKDLNERLRESVKNLSNKF